MLRLLYVSSLLRIKLSRWDGLALFVVITGLTLLIWGSREMTVPFTGTEPLPLSLDPIHLPYYALRTTLRMFFALFLSLLFSFVYASIAAKNKKAELILVPLLDILQSVPILGFLSITVTGFMVLFPGSLLGVECASVFAIFTSQAWNMTFSLYQSFISIPKELTEVASLYQLSPWRRYWRLEVPYAIPQLLWNMMMSVSGGWFFVVASEAITVSGHTILLPGIGSYIALASQQESIQAIFYAILTMLLVILLYDQLLFKPLLAWSDKFKAELTAHEQLPSSWVLTMIRRAKLFQILNIVWFWLMGGLDKVLQGLSLHISKLEKDHEQIYKLINKILTFSFFLFILFVFIFYGVQAYAYIFFEIPFEEVQHVCFLALMTLIRVVTLCAFASLIWVPIGVMVGLNGPLASRLQPWVQFMAAFPANLFFPIVVIVIIKYHLVPDIWLSPLMILGTQWYILFNVIGGASSIPFDFQEVTTNFHVKGWLRWKKLYLPGIAPAYITGLITAAGGSWNASIVAEYVSWGNQTIEAAGVGAYIAAATAAGDKPRILLGVVVLSCFVLILNRIFWRPLYLYTTTRYRLD
ncbi:MAG: ABC transporter permease subunit [Alphaproteobacteria bacterium]|nr:ABC transporter permease subunit [Alphaproteobacteria bacterium]